MNPDKDRLEALRARRDAARKSLTAKLSAAKSLSDPKVLGKRVRADLEIHGRNAMAQAMEIAADNRGVLAGTLTALMLWAARKQVLQGVVALGPKAAPVLAKAKGLLSRKTVDVGQDPTDDQT
ncbi:hypothetical protein EOE18_04955 [Novosphingobium umbonatum]|uniref:Uncharacterized protein n=1 Tax=Novosphingobium umbonatum TaxID=1908524 RepID=A0A437N8D6_9SPHN|nr:hypothetical protein [Novosphingobium umbonatum]RVU06193.1 hypothetical protein EOE18_04955 [Novosphingobium umbonatum]